MGRFVRNTATIVMALVEFRCLSVIPRMPESRFPKLDTGFRRCDGSLKDLFEVERNRLPGE
jgi:hypothetical protein